MVLWSGRFLIPESLMTWFSQPQWHTQHLWDCPRQKLWQPLDLQLLQFSDALFHTLYWELDREGGMISFGQRTQLPSWVRYPKREKLLFCFWDSNFVQKNPGPLTISTFHVCFLFRNSFSIEKCSWKFFRDKINQGITASFPPFFSFWRKKFKKVTGKIIHVKSQ